MQHFQPPKAKLLDASHADRDKSNYENADHEHLYLCDHYWLAACWPGRFRLPFKKQDDKRPGQPAAMLYALI
ncbi:hypothetical protein ACLBWS_11145 [Brucellaceae bacterium D45D]